MKLTLIAGDPESAPKNSPTLYKTDRGSQRSISRTVRLRSRFRTA
jgi:hypothetical protein